MPIAMSPHPFSLFLVAPRFSWVKSLCYGLGQGGPFELCPKSCHVTLYPLWKKLQPKGSLPVLNCARLLRNVTGEVKLPLLFLPLQLISDLELHEVSQMHSRVLIRVFCPQMVESVFQWDYEGRYLLFHHFADVPPNSVYFNVLVYHVLLRFLRPANAGEKQGKNMNG